MNDNLVSMKKLKEDIRSMKLFSLFLKPEDRKKLKEVKQQMHNMTKQFDIFVRNFSDNGWCLYDSISSTIMETANKTFESEGMEAAENILLNYYMNDIKSNIPRLKSISSEFMQRYDLINHAFNDHFERRFYSSIPLLLIIMDGAVNDFTKSKGFFAKGTDVSAWDCLVGCDDSLAKMKSIFNKGRNKTNKEKIFVPYRNGILHGRDLNYANKYVSCKCVAMLFAIADWMSYKNSEEDRKKKYIKEMNPPTIAESLEKYKQIQIDKEEISKWKARKIVVGETVKSNGNPEEYLDYPYIQEIFDLFGAWDKSNYGKLSVFLKLHFSYEPSEAKRAGECRKLFLNKKYISFEFREIEERGCSLSRVLVQANWSVGEKFFSEPLEFGCAYQDSNNETAYPWRDNGEWTIIPWNITALHKC